MSMWDVRGKRCIVTGANSGIGKHTAIQLASRGANIVMVCRSRQRGEAALGEVKAAATTGDVDLMLCDMASLASIRSFGAAFRHDYDRLDVLVNNAGGMFAERTVTEDGFERTFAVNHLGYFLVTLELLDLLKASAPARVVSVSSIMHRYGKLDFDNLQSEKRYSMVRAYGTSKLCNVAFTFALARRLAGSGVTANCLHPGSVASSFSNDTALWFRGLTKLTQRFMISSSEGATTSVHLASSPEMDGVTGKYFARSRVKTSSRPSRDEDAQERLWSLSKTLTQPPPSAA